MSGFTLRLMSFVMPLLRWFMRHWLRVRLSPSDLDELAIDAAQPICYILPVASLADWLALEYICQQYGLPQPQRARHRLPRVDQALVVALPVGHTRHQTDFQRIIDQGRKDAAYRPQMVPVSIFWGQNPIQNRPAWRARLTSAGKYPGMWRKLLMVMRHGRNTLAHFGRPLDFDRVLATSQDSQQCVRKLVRVLRIHFQRQRLATLGPGLSPRDQLIDQLLEDSGVAAEIQATAEHEARPVAQIRKRARRYADEVAADHSNLALALMRRVLGWLWNRIYDGIDVQHLSRLREAARNNREIIYLPSHRSHMDYLLLPYIMHREGLALPQIAAGVNLNFWPVGNLLRNSGAFYLRRSFKGNQLYAAVFRAYMESLIVRGQPMKFYPEGGRSRTGRLLSAKTGLLEMAVTSALERVPDKPVSIVPVYIGYDRVMEVRGYFDELRGTKVKKGESVGDLLRGSRRALKRKYGRVFVSFGQPINIQSFADQHQPDWPRRIKQKDHQERPAWLHDLSRELGDDVMRGINATASLSATGLASLILLGAPQNSVAEDEMIYSLAALTQLARACPYSPDVTVPGPDGRALLNEAEPMMQLIRASHPWGDILTVESQRATLLTYTRNSVMHLFALPSLLANFFTQNARRTQTRLLDEACQLYPLLASEWFLRWPDDQARPALEKALEGMVQCGLLLRGEGEELKRPAVDSHAFATLMSLARVMQESLERYAMTTMLLGGSLQKNTVERERFEQHCQLMAERLALLTGRNSPEFFDPRLFTNHLKTLIRMGLLQQDGDQLYSHESLRPLALRTLRLLSPAVRQTIAHLTARP